MTQIIEFIKFLDAHNGSLTALFTLIYTVATILILLSNKKSEKVAREQLAEEKRQHEEEKQQYEEAKQQYEEENRPRITYEISLENRKYYRIRFTNHGRRVANHVKIKFSQDFLDSIKKLRSFDRSNTLQEKEFILGIGQSYDHFFGDEEFRNNTDKKPIAGDIIYQDERRTYQEPFQIDWEKYATFYSVDSPTDKFLGEMKKLVQELNNIEKILKKQQSTDTEKDTKN